MTVSTNAIVYEAIQRIFRNAVVELIRARLTDRYGDTAADRVATAFPSWEDIKAAAALSSATGVVDHPHTDAFSYLDVSHFTALFNNEFEALVPVEGLPSEVADALKRQILGYLREIKTVRDPVSHPGDEDLDAFDSLRAIDNAVRVARILELAEAAAALGSARAEVAVLAADAPVLASTADMSVEGLPPRDAVVVDFVGRRAEMAKLWEWVADPHSKRWLLTGDGGKGKSAIAYQFATEIVHHPEIEFAAVHWLSAKRRRFSEGEVIRIPDPEFSDLETAVDRLLTDLGWSEHINKPLEAKRLLLCQLVKDFACFIVIDDIDSLEAEQEDAVEFLATELPAAGAKVLLTSRRSWLGMGKSSTTVVGLDGDEAQEFIDSRLVLFGIEASRLSAKQRRRIIKLCEGSPLYMEDLLRLCTFLPVSQALDSWQENAGEKVRRYALERELEMLSPGARELLEACCVSGVPVTALELQHLLGKTENEVVEGLADLRRHHLVPAPELVEDVPRFNVNANLRLLVLAALEGTQRLRKLEAAVAAVTGGDLIGKSSRAIEDYRRQAEVLLRSRHYEKAEETLRRGLDAHPNNPQLFAAMGNVYDRWNPQRVADARGAWQRAYELGSRDRRMYLGWARLEERQHEWQKMMQVAERGLERVPSEDPALLQHAGYAASRLGQSLVASFNSARAAQEFSKADDYLAAAIRAGKAQEVDRHFVARSYRAWVINAQAQNRDSELCRRLKNWLDWDESDASALEEAERQRTRCPDVAALLSAHESAVTPSGSQSTLR